MELWIVLDSLSNEPEVFKTRDEAINLALEILRDYQERWDLEQEDYEGAIVSIMESDNSDYWGTYLGECEVNIFKKSI